MRRKAKLQGMTPEALEFVAARFRVLSEASRLKLILALEEGEKNVTGLVETTGLTQANVSRHLQTLTGAGILGRRKEGPMSSTTSPTKAFSNCAVTSAAVCKSVWPGRFGHLCRPSRRWNGNGRLSL